MILQLSSVLLLASLAATPVDAAKTTVRRRFALVIGSNDGMPKQPLRHAVSDARAMAAVLEQLGGVAQGDATVLVDPSQQDVTRAVEALARRVDDADDTTNPELVFYFSGHSDDQGVWLKGTRVEYPDLRAQLRAVPVSFRVVVLDSCGSGAFTRTKGGSRVPAFLTDASTSVTGEAVLTSSAAAEVAQESDRIGASFFTHHLVSALRGAGDVNRDGKVTLDEAYQHAFDGTLARTERTATGVQHPGYEMAFSGAGAVVMTDLRSTSALLTLAADLQGRVFIRTPEGRLVVELDKRAGTSVELGVEQGRYEVTVVDAERWVGGEVLVRSGQAATVDAHRLHAVPADENLIRGQQGSDARTWWGELRLSPEYVVAATRQEGPFVGGGLSARVFLSGFRPDPRVHRDASEFVRHPDVISLDLGTLSARLFPLPSAGLLLRIQTQTFSTFSLAVGATYYVLPNWELTAGLESGYTGQVALGTFSTMTTGWFASTSALIGGRWKVGFEANGPVPSQNPFWLPEGQMRGVEPIQGLHLALRNAFYVSPRIALDLDVAAALVQFFSSDPRNGFEHTSVAGSVTGTLGARWSFHDAWTIGARTSLFALHRSDYYATSSTGNAFGITAGIDLRWRF